jgi:beta-lactamase regulating signal transducer with metallopeptidase domain/outer membrane protein assembly factor BamB
MTNTFDAFLDLAGSQLWQVTVAAIVVAALVAVFGRKRPHLAYLLWMLVIAKCLTPPLWSSPTGLFSWLRAETHQVAYTLPGPISHNPIAGDQSNATQDVSMTLSSDHPAESDTSSTAPQVAKLDALRPSAHDSADETTVRQQLPSRASLNARRSISWPIGLAILWSCGVVVCSSVVISRRLLCLRAVRRCGRFAEPELQKTLKAISQQLGVRRHVGLVVSSEPFGPAIFGLFRPTILLPAVLVGDRFAERLKPILAHELIHVRRGDILLGALQLAAQIVWWFHPLVWWASRELTRERERCCDEEAVAGLACDPSEYAQALIDVLRSKRQLRPLFAQPGVRPVDITARRLEHIMQSDRGFHAHTPASCWIIGGLVAALLLPGGGLVFELGAADTEDSGAFREATVSKRDWPQYGGGPQRNNVSGETNLPSSWDVETGANINWSAKLGTAVYSSPVMSGDKVLIGTNNGAAYSHRFPEGTDASCLLCFDADSGEFLWQHANAKLATGRVHDWPEIGVCSTSLIEGSRVWYVNNRNEVICLDLDGFYDNENDGPVKDEPIAALGEADVVFDDLLLVSTSHGIDHRHRDQPPAAPSFIAVTKDSGQLVWKQELPSGNLLHGQWSSPAYGVIGGVGQAIFAGGDGWLYSFDVNAIKQGKSELLWKFDCNSKESMWALGGRGTRNNAIAIPVIHGDHVFMAVGQDPEHGEGEGHVWCIDATKRGDISPELVYNENDPATPIPHKQRKAAELDKGEFVKPNPNSGVVWHYHQVDRNGDGKIGFDESMHRSLSSVVVHEGLAVIPDFSGLVHCLDAKTGNPQWSYDMLATVWGTPLVADGKIYIGDEDGDVAILELSRELNLLAEINVGMSVYTTMMAADGTLYIPSQGRLLAIGTSNVHSTLIDDRKPGISSLHSVGGGALQLRSRKDGATNEIQVNGRCRLTFGEGDGAIIVEADSAVIRGSNLGVLGVTDASKAEFLMQGDVALKTANSEFRADSVRYDGSSGQFRLSGVTLRLPPDKPKRNDNR